MNCTLVAVTSIATLLASAGTAEAQCFRRQAIALIQPDQVRWWIDTDLDGDFELGGNPQWGLNTDHFLAGEPLALGATRDGEPFLNGFDDLVVFRNGGSCAGEGEWWIKFHEGAEQNFGEYFVSRCWGLDGDRPVIGDFWGTGSDQAAVVRPVPNHAGWSYFITDTNADLVFNSLDCIYAGFPVQLAAQDQILAGNFNASHGCEDVAVWRDATGNWELFQVEVVAPIGAIPLGSPIQIVQFGLPGDIPLCGDVTGDGLADLMVFRPSSSVLYVNESENGYGNGQVDRSVSYATAIRDMNVAHHLPADKPWNIGAVALSYEDQGDYGRPELAVTGGSVGTCPGGTVQLHADQIGGAPATSYRWYLSRGGTLVDGATGTGSVVSGVNTATLTITNPSFADYGPYVCEVSNNCGQATTQEFSVMVCGADFNCDGFVNGDDFDGFANSFESGSSAADFNRDGFVNGDDYDAFAFTFEWGC